MKLPDEERFALSKIYASGNDFSLAVIKNIDKASVIERTLTGVGFFSTIRFNDSLPDNGGETYWDWNFQHRLLDYGGSFMAWYKQPDIIELEAVVYIGVWPNHFNPDDFSEMIYS